MNQRVLDQEWINLMKEARDLGLSIEEVRKFLENFNDKDKQPFWMLDEEKPSSGFSSIFDIPKTL